MSKIQLSGRSFALLCVGTIVLSIPFITCLGDDTFIYMRIIRNFLDTGRFEYNTGEPCYIMTSITWFFSWAGLTALTGSFDASRYILSVLFHVFAFYALFLLARRLIRNGFIVFLVLCTAYFDPFYLRWFWAGWETSLKVAMAALSLYLLIAIDDDSTWKAYLAAGLCMGAAVLTRAEMLFLALLGLVFLLVKYPRRAALSIVYLAGVAAVSAPWMIYAHGVFGWAVPHTVFAKTGHGISARYLLRSGFKFLQIMLVPMIPILLLLASAFLGSRRRRRRGEEGVAGALRLFREPGAGGAAFVDFCVVGIWGCTVFGYLVTGSYIASVKTIQFAPFIVVALGILADRMSADRPEWPGRRQATILVLLVVLLSVGVQAKLYYRYSVFNPRYRVGADSAFIEFSKEIKELTEPGDEIGLWELGVIGYYSERYIIDFVGLATPGIVRYRMAGGKDYIERFLADRGSMPEYIVRQYGKGWDEGAESRVVNFFGTDYRPVLSRRITRIGGKNPWGYYDLYVLYKLGTRSPDG